MKAKSFFLFLAGFEILPIRKGIFRVEFQLLANLKPRDMEGMTVECLL